MAPVLRIDTSRFAENRILREKKEIRRSVPGMSHFGCLLSILVEMTNGLLDIQTWRSETRPGWKYKCGSNLIIGDILK